MNLKPHFTPSPGALGTLIVVILKARNLPNKRHIGKQDPYCLVRFDGVKQRTRAIKRGGQHPEWDEEFRYELWEDDGSENVAPAGPNGTPPPPPPKKKGPPKIKGGKFLHIACYAEDLREPDFIGETKVDLTEVLTKGETDEWFTLMNKDKYSGEVYVELTFWSNEPEPEQKRKTKAKANRHYGGPGQFTPADDSPGQSHDTIRPGFSHTSQLASASSLYDIARREAVPPSLRPSSSLAKVDLYKAPYETNRSHQSIASMDSITNDFGQLTMQPNHGNRRTSMPHMPSGFQSRQSTMSSSSSVHLEPSQTGFGNDPYAYSAQDGQSYPPVSPNPTGYQPFPTQPAQPAQPALYNPPYETPRPSTVMPGYVRQVRRSLPPTSSGFAPTPASSGFVPVSASSGFVPIGQQHTGYYPPVSATPAPMQNHAPPPPGHTPHPSLYSAHPPPAGPAPTPAPSNFSNHSQQYPASSGFAPSSSYQNIPPPQQQYGYQYAEPPPQQQQYAQPHPYPQAPPRPPTSVNSQHPLPHPPTPPTMQQHTHSAPPDHNTGYDQSAYANVPPPPPLPNNQSPARTHGSRPLPIPGQPQQVRRRHSTIGMQPQPVASHPTGLQPGAAYNPYSQVPPPPPIASSFSTSSVHNQGWQPPPPPPVNGSAAPYPPAYQQQQPSIPGPPPLPTQRAPSRAQPQPPQQQPQQQQPYQPPPSRRQSFSHSGPVYSQMTGQAQNPPPPPPSSLQPRFQQVPPPPPPSTSYGGGSTSHTMALAQSGFASAHSSPTQPPYPGPLPVPPQVPASQSHHGYAVANGGWQ